MVGPLVVLPDLSQDRDESAEKFRGDSRARPGILFRHFGPRLG